ncbi:MAG: ACP S-malonyltransferase [Treponema sp.]|jgi:[acyl-carrier-protein] S-malonyltransferase|nr:ACP S-malonyltransferase [Treponema sp.]
MVSILDQKIVFLFPGQGAQYPGMALDLLETGSGKVKELFDLASEIMGRDMRTVLGDAEALKRGDLAQPAITLANLAAAALLEERGIRPEVCAGHSLGEYAALQRAGVFSVEDCFKLVKCRGKAMAAAAERLREGPGGSAQAAGMAAVIGLAPEQVEALIDEWKAAGEMAELYAANFNSPRQTVVSGTAGALDRAEELFKAAGARRVLRLPVAGPFHSPLIAGALEEFGPVLEATVFHDPRIPVYSNVTGTRIRTGAEAKKLARAQITGPVRWTCEEEAIQGTGIQAALETGPGKTLQGLWRDSPGPQPCYPAGTAADIAALC